MFTGNFIGNYDLEMMRIDMLRDYDSDSTTIPFFLGLGGGWNEFHTANVQTSSLSIVIE